MQTTLLALPPQNPGQAPESPGGGGFTSFLPFLLVLVVVMLFMPLFSRKERHRQKRLTTLKKHDRVVTSGGIYGTVVALEDQTATLEIAKDVRIRVKRSSVFDLEKPGEGKDAPTKAGAKG
ncbi:MAG: preprotein translocase subunit YajC [Planctomycetota bacterium]|jgi:preprotein translocase subunit YajC